MLKKSLVLTLFALMVVGACKKEAIQTYTCSGTTPTYTGTIKAIMDSKCATSGCHSASSKADGIDLSSYTAVKSAAGSDNFLGAIEHLSGYDAMPQGSSKLDDATIQSIYCWVNNSKPE